VVAEQAFHRLEKAHFLVGLARQYRCAKQSFLLVTALTGSGLIFHDPLSHVLHRLVGQPTVSFDNQTPFERETVSF